MASGKSFDFKFINDAKVEENVTVGQLQRITKQLSNFESNILRDIRELNRQFTIQQANHTQLSHETDKTFTTLVEKIDDICRKLGDSATLSQYSSQVTTKFPSTSGTTKPELTDLQAFRSSFNDINMLSLEVPLKLTAFTGTGDILFSNWLRKYEDYADIKNWSDIEKARNLKFFLSDLAREKYEDFDSSIKSNYIDIIGKMKALFESSKMRHVARQSLLACRQKIGESVNTFTERLTRAVKAATVGLNTNTVKEVMLDQFLDKLLPDIAFHVCDAEPATFEEAHIKALHVENLLEARKRARASYLTDTLPITSDVAQVDQLSNTVFELNRIKQGLQEIVASQVPAPNADRHISNSNPNFFRSRDMRAQASNNRYYDNRIVQQNRRFERNYDTRPYCTYCKRLGHLAYNCYQRLTPPNFTQAPIPPSRRSPNYYNNNNYPPANRYSNYGTRRVNQQQTNSYRGNNPRINLQRSNFPQPNTPPIRALHTVPRGSQNRNTFEYGDIDDQHTQSIHGIHDSLQHSVQVLPQINHIALPNKHNKIHNYHKHDSYFPSKMITSMKLLAIILLIVFLLPCGSPAMSPIINQVVGLKMYWPTSYNRPDNTLLTGTANKTYNGTSIKLDTWDSYFSNTTRFTILQPTEPSTPRNFDFLDLLIRNQIFTNIILDLLICDQTFTNHTTHTTRRCRVPHLNSSLGKDHTSGANSTPHTTIHSSPANFGKSHIWHLGTAIIAIFMAVNLFLFMITHMMICTSLTRSALAFIVPSLSTNDNGTIEKQILGVTITPDEPTQLEELPLRITQPRRITLIDENCRPTYSAHVIGKINHIPFKISN